MRKIEIEMLAAVRGFRNWSSGNTTVVRHRSPDGGAIGARVYLHGNHIADVPVGGPVAVNVETLRRWTTSATVSRLRALGVNVRVKGDQPYIDGIRV